LEIFLIPYLPSIDGRATFFWRCVNDNAPFSEPLCAKRQCALLPQNLAPMRHAPIKKGMMQFFAVENF